MLIFIWQMFGEEYMKMVYIRLNNRIYISKLEKIKIRLCNILGIVTFEKFENDVIILIPKKYKKNNSIKKRVLKQIKRFLKKETHEVNVILDVIFDNNILDIKESLKLQNEDNENNEKTLMRLLFIEIIEFIYQKNTINMLLDDIYFFVNSYNKDNLMLIDDCVKHFKNVNIITNNLRKYKRLEELYERNGIIINVSNNKRKSAQNAKIIVNIDFEKSEFEKCYITNKSLILNLTENRKNMPQNFQGIIINDFDINIDEDTKNFLKEFYGNFNMKQLIEKNFINSNKKILGQYIQKDNLKIKNLYGIRSQISMQEINDFWKSTKQNIKQNKYINY